MMAEKRIELGLRNAKASLLSGAASAFEATGVEIFIDSICRKTESFGGFFDGIEASHGSCQL